MIDAARVEAGFRDHDLVWRHGERVAEKGAAGASHGRDIEIRLTHADNPRGQKWRGYTWLIFAEALGISEADSTMKDMPCQPNGR